MLFNNVRIPWWRLLVCWALGGGLLAVSASAGTSFTYQGEYRQSGQLASGSFDMVFSLWDAPSGGGRIGSLQRTGVIVTEGRFATSLDFGAFPTADRWLEIAVGGVILSPRQPVTSAPTATRAMVVNWGGVENAPTTFPPAAHSAALVTTGTLSDARLSSNVMRASTGGTADGAFSLVNPANLFTGAFTGNGSGLTALNASGITAGTLNDARLSSNIALRGAANTFTLNNVFQGNVGVGTILPIYPVHIVSPGNRALFSSATAATGPASGGYLQSASSEGTGVVGLATASTGANVGIDGQSFSQAGTGVRGLATATSGTTYGVRGEVSSGFGYAGYFVGGRNYFEGNVGIGTTAPESPLTVEGTARITGPVGIGAPPNVFYALTVGGRAQFASRVGIGPSLPDHPLDVSTTTDRTAICATVAGDAGHAAITAIHARADNQTPGALAHAVYGHALSDDGTGVFAFATGSVNGVGVLGRSTSTTGGIGVLADASGGGVGLLAHSNGSGLAAPAIKAQQTGTGGIAILAENTSSDANAVFTNRGTGDLIRAFGTATGGDLRFRVTNAGNVTADGSFQGGGADYAEWLEQIDPDEALQPGDVVGVVGGRISKRTAGAQQVMVISTNPVLIGNGAADERDSPNGRAIVAFLGQAPVKVMGSVRVGDFIIASGRDDGTAVAVAPRAATLRQIKHLIGTAWEDSQHHAVRPVNCSISIDQAAALATVLEARESELASLHERLDRLEALFARDGTPGAR